MVRGTPHERQDDQDSQSISNLLPVGAANSAKAWGGRFENVPALDGVRAVALLAVMAVHGGLDFVPGGLFSLDAFFCLSGFLITSLLIAEWHQKEKIGLRSFWARRARRLLPGMLLLLVGVALYVRFVSVPGTYPDLRLDSLSTLFYVPNWHFILAGENYFVQTGATSPLLHTWSLGIEEQFYLVWPMLVFGLLRWRKSLRPLFVVCVVGAIASATEMALLYTPTDITRLYFGTDTHAQSLLVGGALAAALSYWRHRQVEDGRWTASSAPIAVSVQSKKVLAALGVLGALITAWLWTQVAPTDSFTFRGGILLASVSIAAVILSIVLVPTGPVAWLLGWSPLRYMGRISYGMYLWHFPIDQWLDHSATGATGVPLFLLRFALTVVVGTASFYFVERPIRAGALFTKTRAWILTPPAVAAACALVIFGTAIPVAASSAASGKIGPPSTVPVSGGEIQALMVGDSVALTMGIGLTEVGSKYGVNVIDEGQIGCGISIVQSIMTKGVVGNPGWPCSTDPSKGDALGAHFIPWPQEWAQWINQDHPNVVVLTAGRWETVNALWNGHWTDILEPSYAAYVKKQLELAVSVATAGDAKMIIETSPCFDTGEQPNGEPWPEDDPARVTEYNKLVREVGAQYPNEVTVQNLFGDLCPGGTFHLKIDGQTVRSTDGIHIFTGSPEWAEPNGGTWLAPKLLPEWRSLGLAGLKDQLDELQAAKQASTSTTAP